MASKVGEAYLEITANNAQLKKSMRDSEKAGESFVSRMQSSLVKFGKVAFVGAIAGFTALTAIMTKATVAAAAEQVQTQQLSHQLQRLGLDSKLAMREVDELATKQQNLTRFGDTQTRAMLAQLIMLTDDYEGSLKNLSLAQDMAESGMFDERSAARYLGMAMQGNIEMLGRYIPELKTSVNEHLKHMSASEKAAYAIELLNKKFGGLAKTIGDTAAGAWAKLKNAISDAWEALGEGVLESISEGFGSVTDKIKEAEDELKSIGRVAGTVIKALTHAGGVLAEIFEAVRYNMDPLGYMLHELSESNKKFLKDVLARQTEQKKQEKEVSDFIAETYKRVAKSKREETEAYIQEELKKADATYESQKAIAAIQKRIAERNQANARGRAFYDYLTKSGEDAKRAANERGQAFFDWLGKTAKKSEPKKSVTEPRWMGAEDVWKQAMLAGVKNPQLEEARKQTNVLQNIDEKMGKVEHELGRALVLQ